MAFYSSVYKSVCNTPQILRRNFFWDLRNRIFNIAHNLIVWHFPLIIFSLLVHTLALWFRSPTHTLARIVNSLYWDVSACINIDKPYWESGAGLNNKGGKLLDVPHRRRRCVQNPIIRATALTFQQSGRWRLCLFSPPPCTASMG